MLRFITADPIDDGNGTLIGGLLFDTQSILDGQMLALEDSTARHARFLAKEKLDFSLLTDG